MSVYDSTEVEQIISRMAFLERESYVIRKYDDSVEYSKNDVTISVFAGRFDEVDNITICQKNYYDYSQVRNERKRTILRILFGVWRSTSIRKLVRNKHLLNSQMNRLDRFYIMADYLEANLDELLSRKPPLLLRKYHK